MNILEAVKMNSFQIVNLAQYLFFYLKHSLLSKFFFFKIIAWWVLTLSVTFICTKTRKKTNTDIMSQNLYWCFPQITISVTLFPLGAAGLVVCFSPCKLVEARSLTFRSNRYSKLLNFSYSAKFLLRVRKFCFWS